MRIFPSEGPLKCYRYHVRSASILRTTSRCHHKKHATSFVFYPSTKSLVIKMFGHSAQQCLSCKHVKSIFRNCIAARDTSTVTPKKRKGTHPLADLCTLKIYCRTSELELELASPREGDIRWWWGEQKDSVIVSYLIQQPSSDWQKFYFILLSSLIIRALLKNSWQNPPSLRFWRGLA